MSENEGHLHHAQLANLAAMARSIFHQVGATEVAQPELTTLVNFNGANGVQPVASLLADAHGDLFGTTYLGGAYGSSVGVLGRVLIKSRVVKLPYQCPLSRTLRVQYYSSPEVRGGH
jgi:hypothetical protein